MSSKLHQLTVAAVEKTTDDCTLLTFEVPEHLRADFAYKQGQYLTLRAEINGEDVRRSYSLCSSPLDDTWQVAVKQVPEGRFSTYANQVLKAGDTLEVMPPSGRFFVEVEPTRQKNYLAFAAGSGITPILSIIKTHLALEPKATFKLFYVNQAATTVILKEELEGLKNLYMERLEIFHFLTREQRSVPLFNGRLSAEKLEIICKTLVDVDMVDDAFVCGPNAMIFMVRDFLLEKGLNKDQVHFELFNTDGIVAKKPKLEDIDPSVRADIEIIEGGKHFTFSIPQGSDNILDAALKKNADLPYACKGGVCCTCRAKLVEGEVDVLLNYGLEQSEIDEGFVLTCQSVPRSEKIVVNFDMTPS